MDELTQKLVPSVCALISDKSIVIQCAEIIKNNGHRLLMIISKNPQIKIWAQSQNISCFESISSIPKLSKEPIDFLFNIGYSPTTVSDFPAKLTIHFSNSLSSIYSAYAYTRAILNKEKNHGICWWIRNERTNVGTIIKQAIFPVEKSETAFSLKQKCLEHAISTFSNIIKDINHTQTIATKPSTSSKQIQTVDRPEMLPNGGIINWYDSAQEIERLYRALSFGNQNNSVGMLRLLLGKDIFIVKGLRILASRSSTFAGVIQTISEKELIVTTANYNIAISDIYSGVGRPYSIADLTNKYHLTVNSQLPIVSEKFGSEFAHALAKNSQSEAFWVDILSYIMPGLSPLAVNAKNLKKMPAEMVALSKLDLTQLTEKLVISDNKEASTKNLLLTILLVYLYRLNDYQNYTVKFSYEHLKHKSRFKRFFALELPLSVYFDSAMSFKDALKNVSNILQQLMENKTYLQDVALRYPELNLNIEPSLLSIIVCEDITKFQLSEVAALTIVINEEGTEFGVYSRKDVFPVCINTLISNLPMHIKALLASVIDSPSKPICALSLLTKAEKQKILLDWNDTKVDFSNRAKPVHCLFEEQVVRTPNRIAVTFENRDLTYSELNEKSNKIASHLYNQGILPNSIVAVCAQRSLEMVIAILGILKAGCGYLPLDPNYPTERLSYMLTDSNASTLLVDKLHANLKLDKINISLSKVDDILEESGSEYPICQNIENLAYVIYTSGTTGNPKGVVVTHLSLVNHMLWMIPKFNFKETDVFIQKTPFCFDASVWEFFAPLLCGGRLIMASNEVPLELRKLLHLIHKHQVTILQLVPSMLREILLEAEFSSCHSLKKVFSGGEALTNDIIDSFFKTLQGAELHNLYGPTETTIQMATYSYDRAAKRMDAILIGKPIDNAEAYVLDKHLNPVPIGVTGELCIGGCCLAKGYLNREELTLAKFIKSPFNKEKRLYKTGDRVRWLPDGCLEYFGRIDDDQVKVNGHRIELGEIETTLLQHESIRECAVVVQQRSDNKEHIFNNKYLAAYYVKRLDLTHSDTADFIRTWEVLYQSQYSSLDINNFKRNIKGWNSSYTDEAIDERGILEWVDATTTRIKELNPEVILEIGSGSGLILFNMLASCNYYYATDFSKNVIDYTNNVIQKFGYSDKVKAIACTADELPFNQIEKAYDTVIINSVIQYFPSLDYLETVITKVISNIQNSGQIFIGDVRDFRLLKCFHCSVQRYKRERVTKAEIDYFSLRDKELLVSPEYFIYLKATNKDISHVEILPKLGTADHEMNNYRYDVILHVRKNDNNRENKRQNIAINESNFVNVLDLENYVTTNMTNDYIYIKYPNKRIAKDYIAYNSIYNNESGINVSDYDSLLSLSQISEFANKIGVNTKYFIDVFDPFYLYIIIFRNPADAQRLCIDYIFKKTILRLDLASKPLATSKLLENQFSNQLKDYLSTKLPNFMIPSRYIPLEKLPLTSNGKIDRKSLIEPAFARSESYVAPRNEIEHKLCQIWAEVLGLPEDGVGIQDDFFNLGGHSLSALRTLSVIKNYFLIKLPTRTLFDYPIVEKLAELIQKAQKNPVLNTQDIVMQSPIIALQENGFKAPLFLIHPIGGTIFWYKTLSRYLGTFRPIYAIQDPGIDANDLLFRNLEEMASFYLKAIQEIQSTGPYLLAGASFGATVAIEIANQLIKKGEQVKFIGIVDGWPVYSKKFWEKEFFEKLMLQQFQRMDSQFISQGINDVQFLLNLQHHRMAMLRYYKIPLIDAKLTFFKAEELWPVFKEMVLPHPNNCWQPYSTRSVDLHIIPGNHETMFWEPHVQVLAKQMNHSLSKLEVHKLPERQARRVSHIQLFSTPVYK